MIDDEIQQCPATNGTKRTVSDQSSIIYGHLTSMEELRKRWGEHPGSLVLPTVIEP